MRVLVIEDHEELADVLVRGLRRAGLAVDVALDGGEGWFKLGVSDYDVVVLDRDLPVLNGDELCRRLRAQGAGIRVLMLTAAGGPRRAAEGLGLGADDYLAKPFDFVELIARVRALARRPALARPPVLEAASISLDPATRSASRFRRAAGTDAQRVRRAGGAAGRRRPRGQRRGTAGEGVGRERGPVHHRGAHHDQEAAPQAKRPRPDRDTNRHRLPHPP